MAANPAKSWNCFAYEKNYEWLGSRIRIWLPAKVVYDLSWSAGDAFGFSLTTNSGRGRRGCMHVHAICIILKIMKNLNTWFVNDRQFGCCMAHQLTHCNACASIIETKLALIRCRWNSIWQSITQSLDSDKALAYAKASIVPWILIISSTEPFSMHFEREFF